MTRDGASRVFAFAQSRPGFGVNLPANHLEAVLTLILTALLATLTPARRAAHVDPMIALRAD
jgi:hypothetical protein